MNDPVRNPAERTTVRGDDLLDRIEGKFGACRVDGRRCKFARRVSEYVVEPVLERRRTVIDGQQVVPILNIGGEEFAKIGVGKSTGTKLISACGNINKPGVYEIDMTISVEEFIYSDEYCGGIANGKRLKARNARTGLILLSVALAFFVGIILRRWS